VRCALNSLSPIFILPRCRRPLAHPFFGSGRLNGWDGWLFCLTRTGGEHITRTFRGQPFLIRGYRCRQPIEGIGAPDRIRTCDLCLRRATLYPAELRVLSTERSQSRAPKQCVPPPGLLGDRPEQHSAENSPLAAEAHIEASADDVGAFLDIDEAGTQARDLRGQPCRVGAAGAAALDVAEEAIPGIADAASHGGQRLDPAMIRHSKLRALG
jgi:hypothetical protein